MRPRPPAARTALAVALGPLALLAAAPAAGQLTGGLAVGGTAFTVAGTTRSDLAPRTAFGAFAWGEREVRPGVGVGAGVAYFLKGATGSARAGDLFPNDPGVDPDLSLRLRLDYAYVEAPLLVTFRPGGGVGRLRPALYVGPHVSLLQSATTRYGVAGGPLGEADADDAVRGVDAGVTAGVRLQATAGAFGDLVVGLHGSLGLRNLRDAEPALHARGLFLYAGVAF